MPFEIPQKPEVGQFQKFADAMLLGCKTTKPRIGGMFGSDGSTCALGALYVGLGWPHITKIAAVHDEIRELRAAYLARYGTEIHNDNDRNGLSREEIALRVAML